MKKNNIKSAIMASIALASFGFNASAAIFTVTNTSNDINVYGSLPWAILQANYNGNGFDEIHFNIPGPGPYTITLQGRSSFGGAGGTIYVQEQIKIDATTQPGYSGEPLIDINVNGNDSGIYLVSGNVNTIQGLAIYNYASNAITVSSGSSKNWILSNWLGFTVNPTNGVVIRNFDLGHQLTRGIGIQSSYNVIQGNVISGVDNAITIGEEIRFSNDLTSKYITNYIAYNIIGLDPDGSRVIGNHSDGVFLGAGAAYNFIGPGNIISGNDSAGVELLHPSNIGNVIFSNVIGMDKTATTPLPNGELGVLISNGASGNCVGGPFGGNFIGYNRLGGVVLGLTAPSYGTVSYANSNWVQFNVLAGNAQQANNQTVGVSIEGGSSGNVVQANSIVGQKEHGIQLINSNGNNITGNWIGMNGYGQTFGNLGYGIFSNSSNYNFLNSNVFGYNGLGYYGQINSFGNAF